MTHTSTEGRSAANPRELMEGLDRSLRTDASRTEGIDAIFAFLVGGPSGGAWWIEARKGSGGVHRGTPPAANVTIHLSDEVLMRLGSGELQGSEAFMQGLLRVEGDRSKAIFLTQIFGQ